MTSTENTAGESHEEEPIKALFDLASYWATVWGFVALAIWLEQQLLDQLSVPSGGSQIAVLAVSTLVVFWTTAHYVEKDAKVRALVDRARYVAILAVAGLLGAYLQANLKDRSYESKLREGAFQACAEIAACRDSASKYANYR